MLVSGDTLLKSVGTWLSDDKMEVGQQQKKKYQQEVL